MNHDVIIVGSGAAGLSAAITLARTHKVLVLAKGELTGGSTSWAQGGIAAVLDAGDTFENHINDTMVAGAGLNRRETVEFVVENAPASIARLEDMGVPFNKEAEVLHLTREGGHSHRRIVHVDDATGWAVQEALQNTAAAHPNITLRPHMVAIDLIIDRNAETPTGTSNVWGVYALDNETGHVETLTARATIIASGGAGRTYLFSTAPRGATGDGIAMAWRAGARVSNMEMMQFHPTCLYNLEVKNFLITEAVRGEGAWLIDRNEYRFMPDYHELAELAPRDIVSRSILAQMKKTSYTHVYLDARRIGSQRFAERFPGIFRLLQKFDIDPGKQPIPIHPSAHYMIGGVQTDPRGRTNVTGLYACGEVACTGLYGANRLASNSLLEGLVCGEVVGRICHETAQDAAAGPVKIISDIRPSDRSELDLADVRSSLRSVMWRHVGIERDGGRLHEVSEMCEFWARYTLDKIFDERAGWELQNMLLVGALITHAASWREESRGTHYRFDHPEPRESFRVHDLWHRGSSRPETRAVLDEASATQPG